jgi:hypothetical protein
LIVLERGAGEAEAEGGGDQRREFLGGGGGRQAGGTDIRETIALGVGAAGARVEGEVGAEAVGCAETGAFAEEHEREAGAEERADLVLERDAGVADDTERREGETGGAEAREQRGEERWSLALGGEGGEAVADQHDEVGLRKLRAEV